MRALLLYVFGFWLALSALGQSLLQETLHGVVNDRSGAALERARVEIKNIATRETQVVETDHSGYYTFAVRPAGRYEITVQANGFELLRRIVSLSPGQAETTENFSLEVATREDTVTVLGASGYSVPEVASVSKIDIPIAQLPFAVQVVPATVIEDQQATRLPDVTRNVSGVQSNFGYGELYEAFAIRGFETNVTLRNSERVSGGIGRSKVEVDDLESVEVLKGLGRSMDLGTCPIPPLDGLALGLSLGKLPGQDSHAGAQRDAHGLDNRTFRRTRAAGSDEYECDGRNEHAGRCAYGRLDGLASRFFGSTRSDSSRRLGATSGISSLDLAARGIRHAVDSKV